MSMQFVHPSRSKLRDWLSALNPSEKVTVHVESCERCASRLVDLSDRETSAMDKATDEALLAQVVRAEWAPPADLAERVIRGIDERQRNQRDLSVMLELFRVATETASLMMPPDPAVVPQTDSATVPLQPDTGVAAPAPLPEPDGDIE